MCIRDRRRRIGKAASRHSPPRPCPLDDVPVWGIRYIRSVRQMPQDVYKRQITMFIAISTHPVRTKYKAKSYQSAALRTTSFILFSLWFFNLYRTMHTGEGKTKNPGWPASRISYLTSIFPSIPLTIQEQRKECGT